MSHAKFQDRIAARKTGWALGGLAALLLRIKIFQAVKLGETA